MVIVRVPKKTKSIFEPELMHISWYSEFLTHMIITKHSNKNGCIEYIFNVYQINGE